MLTGFDGLHLISKDLFNLEQTKHSKILSKLELGKSLTHKELKVIEKYIVDTDDTEVFDDVFDMIIASNKYNTYNFSEDFLEFIRQNSDCSDIKEFFHLLYKKGRRKDLKYLLKGFEDEFVKDGFYCVKCGSYLEGLLFGLEHA